MSKLYIFNPDSDLALANGDPNYMAPASARQMAADLALLPAWYAEPGSCVLAASAYNLSFLKEMQARLPLDVSLMTEPEVTSAQVVPAPWGWNPAIRKRLAGLGVSESLLLSPEQITALRQLSHRQRAVELLPALQLNEQCCGESSWLATAAEWKAYVETHETCLLKAPLSGSGKGLNWCRGVYTPYVAGWCARTAELQGGVVGEPVYDKVHDFAMEFLSDGNGQVSFAGYSLFVTGSGGAYEGSYLLSDVAIEQRLAAYIPVALLQELVALLKKRLAALLGTTYRGYLGVDMMICRFADEPCYRIHPCVEINLRMNMGVVARLLYDCYLSPAVTGRFCVTYHSAPGEALAVHRQMEQESPLQIADGRVWQGYLPLTPVTRHTHYRAWAFCES